MQDKADTENAVQDQPPKPRAWQKGGPSPNPRGKPAGVGWVVKTREQLRQGSLGVLATMHKLALAGDVGAARLILERSLPALRAGDDLLKLDTKGGSLSEQAAAILSAALKGKITPGQAGDLLGHLQTVARVIETDDLAKRITALEAQ